MYYRIYFTIVIVAPLSTMDVWRGMTYVVNSTCHLIVCSKFPQLSVFHAWVDPWSYQHVIPRQTSIVVGVLLDAQLTMKQHINKVTAVCYYRSGLRSLSETASYFTPRLRTKFGERAFSFSGPTSWNSLPTDLRTVSDASDFKNKLKLIVLS